MSLVGPRGGRRRVDLPASLAACCVLGENAGTVRVKDATRPTTDTEKKRAGKSDPTSMKEAGPLGRQDAHWALSFDAPASTAESNVSLARWL